MELEAVAGCEGELFARGNVERAWLRMKQRFPLLGASVEELPGTEKVEFVLRESALHILRPGELNYLDDLHNADEVAQFREKLHNGPTVLDNEFLARVWFGSRKDVPCHWHIFIPVVHHITDAMGNATIVRELCQELSSLSKEAKIDITPLAARLQTVLPTEAYTPSAKLSPARRRWRLVIAKVIQELNANKMTGGHTLPTRREITSTTPLSRIINIRFTISESQQIAQTCRALGITVGNALPVLSQLAFARVLHRLRRQGKISDAEWEYRAQQPMHYTGPVNYRPYLDRGWYDAGGADEVYIAISFYTLTLPFMPRPASPDMDATGAPPLKALLSPARFLARARMARAQSKSLLSHPLLHEFHALRLPTRNERTRTAALAWRARQEGRDVAPPAVAAEAGRFTDLAPCVFSNGGASMGNRDHILPETYPRRLRGHGRGAPEPAVRLRLLSSGARPTLPRGRALRGRAHGARPALNLLMCRREHVRPRARARVDGGGEGCGACVPWRTAGKGGCAWEGAGADAGAGA
ncbi:uncharacterized protein PHACADRAFT_246598, partial [Phanerochaete carnosa HHB-10118-sp]